MGFYELMERGKRAMGKPNGGEKPVNIYDPSKVIAEIMGQSEYRQALMDMLEGLMSDEEVRMDAASGEVAMAKALGGYLRLKDLRSFLLECEQVETIDS